MKTLYKVCCFSAVFTIFHVTFNQLSCFIHLSVIISCLKIACIRKWQHYYQLCGLFPNINTLFTEIPIWWKHFTIQLIAVGRRFASCYLCCTGAALSYRFCEKVEGFTADSWSSEDLQPAVCLLSLTLLTVLLYFNMVSYVGIMNGGFLLQVESWLHIFRLHRNSSRCNNQLS